jgi:hypothetical protein
MLLIPTFLFSLEKAVRPRKIRKYSKEIPRRKLLPETQKMNGLINSRIQHTDTYMVFVDELFCPGLCWILREDV